MIVSQAPTVPTVSDLASLNPIVASLLLIAVIVGIAGYYGKDFLKARLGATPKPEPATVTPPGGATPLPALIDRADVMADKHIQFLEGQLEEMDRKLDVKDREIQRLNDLLLRNDQWRRGPT